MRVLFYTIFILSSGTACAQAETPVILNGTTNSVPATNNTNVIPPSSFNLEKVEEEESLKLDSSAYKIPAASKESLELKDIHQKPSRKKFKASRKAKEAATFEESESLMEDAEKVTDESINANEVLDDTYSNSQSTKALEMQNMSTGFSSTYSTSDMQRTSRSPSVQQQFQMMD